MKANCKYCEQPFEAKRKTAEYCCDAHRVAAYRAKEKIKKNFPDLHRIISGLSRELMDEKFSHDAAVLLSGLRLTIDNYFPPKTRWWACGNCGRTIMTFMPHPEHCACGDAAKWYIRAL